MCCLKRLCVFTALNPDDDGVNARLFSAQFDGRAKRAGAGKFDLSRRTIFISSIRRQFRIKRRRILGQTPRPYCLPENPTSLYPKLPPNRTYEDGSAGEIEFPSPGSFRAPIELSRKQPGVYTIVVWIQRGENAEPFQATHVCVRAE